MKSVERKKVINLYKHYIGVVETALSKEELEKVKAAYRYSDDLIT